jgi:anti-sigma factor ChrR (cupin superfamily)
MIGVPKTGCAVARAVDGWSEDGPGVWIKPLVDDSAGYRTTVMRVDPGPLGEAHFHDEIEQVYVIEGDFFDEEGSYGPGDLVIRAAGAMHRSGSETGCTMLLIYTPAAKVSA